MLNFTSGIVRSRGFGVSKKAVLVSLNICDETTTKIDIDKYVQHDSTACMQYM